MINVQSANSSNCRVPARSFDSARVGNGPLKAKAREQNDVIPPGSSFARPTAPRRWDQNTFRTIEKGIHNVSEDKVEIEEEGRTYGWDALRPFDAAERLSQ